MITLFDDNEADIIEAFNSTSRDLDDLFNIDNHYFEGNVNKIYPAELLLNNTVKLIIKIPRPPFWINIYLFLTVLFPLDFVINAITCIFHKL